MSSCPAFYCDPARLRAERGHPLILGHRGIPGSEVENRLEAFQAALAAGADGVEFDVQLSADGTPMIIHDLHLERTTGRPGRVREFAAAQLGELGLPRLETALEHLPAEAVLNVEIKDFGLSDRGLERRVVALVKERGALGRVLFSSFNPWALARLSRADRRLYAAQLTGPGWLGSFRLGYLRRPGAVHPHFLEVTPARLVSWRRRGWRVVVWGADSEAEQAEALGWDVDGIITDRPGEAARLARVLFTPSRGAPAFP